MDTYVPTETYNSLPRRSTSLLIQYFPQFYIETLNLLLFILLHSLDNLKTSREIEMLPHGGQPNLPKRKRYVKRHKHDWRDHGWTDTKLALWLNGSCGNMPTDGGLHLLDSQSTTWAR
ncbi:hypothetical protein J6590_050003 [Homalodisca vitripennis]|nr:hypothetical protein J6590_050003 [Homalodisca vitripennis]